jgi:hypothetical protein
MSGFGRHLTDFLKYVNNEMLWFLWRFKGIATVKLWILKFFACLCQAKWWRTPTQNTFWLVYQQYIYENWGCDTCPPPLDIYIYIKLLEPPAKGGGAIGFRICLIFWLGLWI